MESLFLSGKNLSIRTIKASITEEIHRVINVSRAFNTSRDLEAIFQAKPARKITEIGNLKQALGKPCRKFTDNEMSLGKQPNKI